MKPFSHRSMLVAALVGGWAAQAAGCSSPGAVVATDAEMDTGEDAGGARCQSDLDCSDHVFCNGAERCQPGAANADADGCVPASTSSPCLTGQQCDETRAMCVTSCGGGTGGDADGDGHVASSCGGDDCDDSDANAFPGHPEVCDVASHDEDCDPTTFGFRDSDGDSASDAACCNVDGGGVRHCGEDCNDSRPNVAPRLVEACDGLDNDCDAATDEGVSQTFYPDTDGDGFGDDQAPTSAWMMGCFAAPGFSALGTDCNDADSAIHPGALEQCDLAMADENCDGDANPATLCTCSGDVTRMCATLGGVCSAGTERCVAGSWGLCSIGPTVEICNGLNDDCDADVDEGLSVTCYPDADNDGYAAAGAMPGRTCPVPGRDGFAGCPPNQTNRAPLGSTGIDCDDANSTVSPGSAELCDVASADENCDGIANPPSLCMCADGDMRTCTASGSCGAGSQICSGGHWSSCSVNPVAESCNLVDDDCDGQTDEGLTVVCYADNDNDGFAVAGAPALHSCPVMGRAYVGGCPTAQTNVAPTAGSTDCDDARATTSPSAIELCDTAMVDENCDGVANPPSLCACSGTASRQCPSSGACAAGTQTCMSGTWGLCSISPVAESCNGIDDNCNGQTDEMLTVTCYPDADNDGYAASGASAVTRCPDSTRGAVGGCPAGLTNRAPTGGNIDCDDASAGRSPGASETCNAIDDNCNGTADEGVTITCYPEVDGDGYPPAGAAMVQRCADLTRGGVGGCPLGTTNRGPGAGTTDCNDASATVSPAATELCDAAMVDENCDGMANPAALCACSGAATRACAQPGACASGSQTCSGGVWGACSIVPITETCNGIDDNCNGMVDESLTVTCYADADGDAYGAGASSARCPDATRPSFGNCPAGYTNASTDCNDANAGVRPGATEVCNGIDDNCAGGIDEGVTVPGCYADTDSDTYGAGAASTQCRDGSRSAAGFCPIGFYNRAGDCNDARALQNPGVMESCNGIDDDCDAMIDDGVLITYYRDVDHDGFGVAATTATACTAPAGFVAASGDCADSDPSRYPGAAEICDGVDQDCDGTTSDEPFRTFYRDADSDLYGDPLSSTMACSPPAGYVENASDCSDATALAHPGGTEICDAYDDDCDGMLNESPATSYCPGDYPLAAHVASWACSGPASACAIGACASGYADCDGMLANGCEVNTNTDGLNCGSCGRACSVGASCGSGACPSISNLVVGANTSCITYSFGTTACWGANGSGRLGTGSSAPSWSLVPLAAPQLAGLVTQGQSSDILQLSTDDGSVGLRQSGNNYYGIGLNQYGQLGDGTTLSPRMMPSFIGGSSAGSTSPLSYGARHGCRIDSSFNVQCTGDDSVGAVGDGAGVTVTGGNWLTVLTGGTWGAVSSGMQHSCARSSTDVRCWGLGTSGQLGNGAATTQFAPVVVTGLVAIEVQSGVLFNCARRTSDNRVLCWGDNTAGQLGDGTTTMRTAPVLTGTLTASRLATGWRHACAITGGTVSCWGLNTSGQIGDGSVTSPRLTPTATMGLTNVTMLGAGNQHTCAVDSVTAAGVTTQRVYCWGRNGNGQVGDGTMTSRSSPTLVMTVVSP